MTEHKDGVLYGLKTTDGKEILLNFCHKDGDRFIHGITDEELVEVLISRYRRHINMEESKENYQISSLLSNVRSVMLNRKSRKSKMGK